MADNPVKIKDHQDKKMQTTRELYHKELGDDFLQYHQIKLKVGVLTRILGFIVLRSDSKKPGRGF